MPIPPRAAGGHLIKRPSDHHGGRDKVSNSGHLTPANRALHRTDMTPSVSPIKTALFIGPPAPHIGYFANPCATRGTLFTGLSKNEMPPYREVQLRGIAEDFRCYVVVSFGRFLYSVTRREDIGTASTEGENSPELSYGWDPIPSGMSTPACLYMHTKKNGPCFEEINTRRSNL